jgi:hypothetical protein
MYVNAQALLGGIQLPEQAGQVPKTLGLLGVLEGLVLRKDVDERLPDVIAVVQKELPAPVA